MKVEGKMGLSFACIVPHGAEAIPQLAGNKLESFNETTRGMRLISEMMRKKRIDTVVIATPHNLRLRRKIGVILTEFAEGTLRNQNASIQIRLRCDRVLAEDILQRAEKDRLPVVGVNYGTSEGEASCMPMDWGTLIPLWFLRCQMGTPKMVMVTPSREIPLQNLVRFGSVIAQAAEKRKDRVAFVASADQAHTHKRKGPYGFHKDSAKFDQLVVDAVRENKVESILKLDPQLVENAKPDSIWQMSILVGILKRVPMQGRLISYQAPTYFGMLSAAYAPK
jgi:aromatic ring-opening dioxygenase LigB subunit